MFYFGFYFHNHGLQRGVYVPQGGKDNLLEWRKKILNFLHSLHCIKKKKFTTLCWYVIYRWALVPSFSSTDNKWSHKEFRSKSWVPQCSLWWHPHSFIYFQSIAMYCSLYESASECIIISECIISETKSQKMSELLKNIPPKKPLIEDSNVNKESN